MGSFGIFMYRVLTEIVTGINIAHHASSIGTDRRVVSVENNNRAGAVLLEQSAGTVTGG